MQVVRKIVLSGLLGFALLFVAAGSSLAQIPGGGFVGYEYPSGRCSPVCTGASVSLNIPTFSGASIVYAWIGIQTFTGDGVVCTSGCLGQFGVEDNHGTLSIWYELTCFTGGTGCGAVTPISGLTVSAGDTITLTLLCTLTCTGSSGDQMSVTITDITTGLTCFVLPGGTCGTSAARFTWPLSLNNQVLYVYEVDGIVTWTPSGRWSGATYTTGLPGSQITNKTPLNAVTMGLWTVGQGAGASKSMSMSAPLDINNFNICPPITSAVYNACAIGPYTNSIAMGAM